MSAEDWVIDLVNVILKNNFFDKCIAKVKYKWMCDNLSEKKKVIINRQFCLNKIDLEML